MQDFDPKQVSCPALSRVLPEKRDLFYGGAWHQPRGGYSATISPGTGESLGPVAEANRDDVDAAVAAAHEGFLRWRKMKPFERTTYLRRLADAMRAHAEELALLDAGNCGDPVTPMLRDVYAGAQYVDFFAGITTEVKGVVTPMGPWRGEHDGSRTARRLCPHPRL